ncbi:MAG: hypothetical protein J6U20_10460 [Fibrobacter sp.]|nr:hypothetical protein [Fibrobacter sp.]
MDNAKINIQKATANRDVKQVKGGIKGAVDGSTGGPRPIGNPGIVTDPPHIVRPTVNPSGGMTVLNARENLKADAKLDVKENIKLEGKLGGR